MMEDTPNKRLAYPTKLFEYIRFGIYPVSMDFGYAKEILEDGKLGKLCQYGDVKSWLRAFDSILNDSTSRDKTLENIKQADNDLYSWPNEKLRFLEFIKSCISSSK